MYGELYDYLVSHRELAIPGVGKLKIERTPARMDIAEKVIHAPEYNIVYAAGTFIPTRDFFQSLSIYLGITEREAVIRFNDFAYDMQAALRDGSRIIWKGVGTISSTAGNNQFEPDELAFVKLQPERAEKIIRMGASHAVRVGEEHRTSEQMKDILKQEEEVKTSTGSWWTWPLVIGIASVMFIGWYFSSQGGVKVNSAGNKNAVPVKKAPVLQKEMR